MATVHLEDVTKVYGQQTILNQINLTVEAGEFVAVIGPSGCGKSTLLRLVAGLDQVTEGRILINNQCVNSIPPARRNMAMVFQNYALYPHMTAFDNMAYGLRLRGMSKSEITKQVQDAAALLQLTPYLTRKPSELSGGQRQRVAMGRAIVRHPAVFLFDEPLSNLDAKLRASMRHEIKLLHHQLKTTSLYVTHDHTEAMTMAERLVILNQGKIEQVGTPQSLYLTPASLFVAELTGLYPINFIRGMMDMSAHKIVTSLGVDFPMPLLNVPVDSDREVMIGIRPEHVHLVPAHKEGAIPVTLDFIDDLGADRLIHLRSIQDNHRLIARIPADALLPSEGLGVELILSRGNVFDAHLGHRLGGFRGI
jgi:sn-glycerol 3-phosphate transport system ATP-binding protein